MDKSDLDLDKSDLDLDILHLDLDKLDLDLDMDLDKFLRTWTKSSKMNKLCARKPSAMGVYSFRVQVQLQLFGLGHFSSGRIHILQSGSFSCSFSPLYDVVVGANFIARNILGSPFSFFRQLSPTFFYPMA